MSERQNIEWKQSWHVDYLKRSSRFHTKEKTFIRRWICGFANAQGGTLYIGKDDDGKVAHLDNFHEIQFVAIHNVFHYG